MVLVNFGAYFHATPFVLKHARAPWITLADLVAPLFLFILGMMFRKSLLSRISKAGRVRAYAGSVRRYLLLLLLGVAGGSLGRMQPGWDWGILQCIGLAGILALPAMELNAPSRTLAGACLSALYAEWILPSFRPAIAAADQGGPYAVPAWSAIVLFSSVAAEWLDSREAARSAFRMLFFGLAFLATGLALSVWIPLDKPLVSASYILVATGTSALTLAGFTALVDVHGWTFVHLEAMGRNALLLFMLHYVLVKIAHRLLGRDAGIVLALAGALATYAACAGLAVLLDRRRIYWKL